MKSKRILTILATISVLTVSGCNPPNNASDSPSDNSVQSSSQSSVISSSSSKSSTAASSKPQEEMHPEVKGFLDHLKSLKESANEKYLEMESKYGDISKFPSADLTEWKKRLEAYSSYLKQVHSLKLNSAEQKYLDEISKIKLLP